MTAPDAPILAYRVDPAYELRQRIFDVAIAGSALVVASPILGVAALAIWLEDGGPVIFAQRRVGRYGRLFTIYKLRTMGVANSVDAVSPTSAKDMRVTRVGRWLRKTSIDELPQLVNVLLGQMTIVGPRPEMPFLVRRYAPWQHLRHLVKPGITGLWQTTVRKTLPLHEPAATAIDLDYIRGASTLGDGRLVLQTFGMLLSTSGAY